ncbi:MAG: ATP-dependent helicase, partial [Candidatus Omnitrophota bacterium]
MNKKYVLKTAAETSVFTIDYRKELNPSQHEVVTEADGPCLVLAGAGSGKTRTLIYRVAYLLEKGVRPEEILLVTFTNKAAQEMRNRVELLLKTKAKGLWCGTFHHIGNRTLRMYGRHIGLNEAFSILDEEDGRDLIKVCMKSLDTRSLEGRFPKPAVVQSILSFAVNAKKKVAEVVTKQYPYFSQFIGQFERIKALYEEKKRKTHNLDYDDLLVKWIGLLDSSSEVRDRLTRQFRFCLVDEYQDTNRLQHEVIRILSGHHRNLLVVGDDAQSIYSFRAAEVQNILRFPEDHANARIFKLETNYRSTRPILELANHSIKHNVHQFPKTLKSVQPDGSSPQYVRVRDTRQEAAFVVQRILEFTEAGIELGDIAVLFRAHYHAAEIEMELAKRGIAYIVRGGVRFFEQAHVKDVLAYLRILMNPMDEIAWIRVLTLQPGIGPA